jgi:hypothetical protein
MTATRLGLGALAGATGVLCFSLTLNADAPAGKDEAAAPAAGNRVPVAVARDRAKLMHGIYGATLESVHHHYFRRDRAVLPARALEDVFAEIDRQSDIKTRWIAVNTPAMSITHEPQTAFEKKAAEELAAGKPEYVAVEKGFYHRAGPIPLGVGCVGCHTKFFTEPPKTPRFAGLVISIPVTDE